MSSFRPREEAPRSPLSQGPLARATRSDRLDAFLTPAKPATTPLKAAPASTAKVDFLSGAEGKARGAVISPAQISALRPSTEEKLAGFLGGGGRAEPNSQAQRPAADSTKIAREDKLAEFLGNSRPAPAKTSTSPVVGGSLANMDLALKRSSGSATISVSPEVRRTFERSDKDQDGKVSMAETSNALIGLRLDVDPKLLRKIFIDLDTDLDLKLKLTEFAELVSRVQSEANGSHTGSIPKDDLLSTRTASTNGSLASSLLKNGDRSTVGTAPQSIDLTTGIAGWRLTRSHGDVPAGRAPTTAPHAAWYKPRVNEGRWLGSSSKWPIGEVTFEVEFTVSAPEVANFTLAYAVDKSIKQATLNGKPLDCGRAKSFRQCGGDATIIAPEGKGLFAMGTNVLSVTVANGVSSASPMGFYATGKVVTGAASNEPFSLTARQAFDAFDLNRSGQLDFRELRQALAKLGLPSDSSTVLDTMRTFDADSSGTLGFREFEKLISLLVRPATTAQASSPKAASPKLTPSTALAAPSFVETRRAFDAFDLNRSGQLDFRELRQALAKLGLPSDSSTVLDTMRTFDADSSGTLGFREFEKLISLLVRPATTAQVSSPKAASPKLTPSTALAAPSFVETRRAFDAFDLNRSGQLDFRELRQALAKLGLPSDSSTVLDTMRTFDADSSGTLGFREFEKLISLLVRPATTAQASSPKAASPKLTPSTALAAPSFVETRRAFDAFDVNRSGQLDFRELRQALAKLGLPSDSSTVLDTMRTFDADSSGTLGFREFEKLISLLVRPATTAQASSPKAASPKLTPSAALAAPSFVETRRAFDAFDLNRSGQLDFRELRQALAKLGLPSDSSTVLDTMRTFDADSSGTLGFREFEKLISLLVRPATTAQASSPKAASPKLTPSTALAAPSFVETRRAFDAFDLNRSGQLDFRELRQALAKLGLPSDSSTVLDTMRTFDADSSGTLGFREFEKLISLLVRPATTAQASSPKAASPKLTPSAALAAPSFVETRRAFDAFDLNRSGQLDFRELRQALAKLGLPSDSSTVLDTMRTFDADSSGTLGFREFEKLISLLVRPATTAQASSPKAASPKLTPSTALAAPSFVETRRAFDAFDLNRSGQLDFRELRQALAKLGLPSDSSTVLDTMRTFDADSSGTLGFREFEKLISLLVRPATTAQASSPKAASPKLTSSTVLAAPSFVETRRAFDAFDLNRSGQLDFRELRQALAKLGLPSDSSTVLDTMRTFDADSSGTLGFREFEKLISLLVRPATTAQRSSPTVVSQSSWSFIETRRAFDAFDVNRSGQLDFRELRQALAKLGLPSDSPTVLDTMRMFDVDSSGTLGFAEFEKLASLIRDSPHVHPSPGSDRTWSSRPRSASVATTASVRRTAIARLEPLLSCALDATLVEQPAEQDVLRFFTRNVASLAYGGDKAFAAQEQRLGRSLDGIRVDNYLHRVRGTLESVIQQAVAACVADLASEHDVGTKGDAVGSLLTSNGFENKNDDARLRIVPYLEQHVERSSHRESDDERRRREAEDARRKAELAARVDEVDAARKRAAELASAPRIFDESGGIHLARDFNSDAAARLTATRRCRAALEGGSGAAPAVREALVRGGHVAKLVSWAQGGQDARLMREAAWVLALLHNEGGIVHREAVAAEKAGSAGGLVAALSAPPGDIEGDRAAAAAAQALCDLVGTSAAARDAALANGVLAPLLVRMRRGSSSMSSTGPKLLAQLARGKPAIDVTLMVDALPILCELTANTDTMVATDATSAIAALLDGHDHQVEQVLTAAPDVPRRLVDVLSRPDATTAASRPQIVPPEVLRIFNRYDANGSGALSRSEVRRALNDLGLDTSRTEADAVLRQFDADRSGTLSPTEFLRLAARLGFPPAVTASAAGGSRDGAGMLTSAVRAISSICACGNALAQAVIDCGGLQALVKLIDCPLADARKEALLALSNVAAGSPEQVAAMLSADAFAPIAKRMGEGMRDFNKEAVWTIANATVSGDAETLLAIAGKSRIVAALVEMVTDPDVKLAEVALEGLHNLLKAGASSNIHPSVRRAFERYDANKSGKLSRSELRRALIDLGLDLSRQQATAILRQYDSDGDGTLSPSEFATLAVRLGAPRSGANPIVTQMRDAGAERILRTVEVTGRGDDGVNLLSEKVARVLDTYHAGLAS